MKMKLLGFATRDFTSESGQRIVGHSIFVCYDGDESVIGQATDKLFVREGIPIPPTLELGMDYDVQFDRRGKIIAIYSAK